MNSVYRADTEFQIGFWTKKKEKFVIPISDSISARKRFGIGIPNRLIGIPKLGISVHHYLKRCGRWDAADYRQMACSNNQVFKFNLIVVRHLADWICRGGRRFQMSSAVLMKAALAGFSSEPVGMASWHLVSDWIPCRLGLYEDTSSVTYFGWLVARIKFWFVLIVDLDLGN